MRIILKWYNEQWNIYIDCPTKVMEVEKRTERYQNGNFNLRRYETDLGFDVYHFGWFADDPKRRPGHGGEWSSRQAIANDVFKTQLVEIGLNSWACNMQASDLKKILPEGASLILKPAPHSSTEYYYRVFLKDVDTKVYEYTV